MLSRAQVYGIIDAERKYQDFKYIPEEPTSSGLTRLQRDLDVAPGILLLDEYVQKATIAWSKPEILGDNIEALQYVAKIAAIAVRVLERAGGSDRLLRAGLR